MAAVLNADVKSKILASAVALLQDKAFATISLGSIAEKAGISKGTLYYYYSNKDDILFDIADKYLNELAKALLDWTGDKAKDTSLPRLLSYVFKRGVYNESGNLRLYLIGAAVSGHEALRLRLTEKYNYFKSTLADKLRERTGADGEYYAWLVLCILDGMLIQDRLATPEFDSDAFISGTVRLLQEQLERSGINE